MKSWLAVLIGLLVGLSVLIQGYHLYTFVNAGPRFTATDGQELCARVRALEMHSYGFRDAGRMPLDCEYNK